MSNICTLATVAQKYKVTKYPTLKLFRFGQLVKKEYRYILHSRSLISTLFYSGQRSAEALKEFILKQVQFSVAHINEADVLDNILESNKRNIVGYFTSASGVEYENFQKVASALRDECAFHVGIGEWARQKNPAGNSLFYRAPHEHNDFEYTGPLANYDYLL